MKFNILVSALVALVVTVGGSFFSNVGNEGTQLGGQIVSNTETHTNDLKVISETGTSTLYLKSGTSGKGGCIELTSTSSSQTWKIALVASSTVTGQTGYLMYKSGTCE